MSAEKIMVKKLINTQFPLSITAVKCTFSAALTKLLKMYTSSEYFCCF